MGGRKPVLAKGRFALNEQISFYQNFFKPFSKRQNLDSSKLKNLQTTISGSMKMPESYSQNL